MDVMTLAAKLTLNTSEYDSSLSSSEKKMKQMSWGGIAWGNVISQAVTKAAKATVSFGKDVIQVGMDFDSAMSQVKALGQLENDDFVTLRKRAMDLGASTKFTAAQVAEAFSYMALAGWDTEEMLAGIDGVLNLAAASGEDLGRTSDIVTDAITAMGLTAADSTHFVDVLAAASANSNTTVSQMGEAFKYLATTGGVLEYSIEDVATVLGLLANNGIKASQAGTSMRQILNTLINPTDKAADAMEKLGISLFDPLTNARKPLGQVLKEFRDTFKDAGLQLKEGFDPAELEQRVEEVNSWYDAEVEKINSDSSTSKSSKNKLLKALEKEYVGKLFDAENPNQAFLASLGDIGGLRGISSLFAIMASTDEDFQQLTESIANSEGDAEEMSKTMLDNLQGDITILNSAMEGLKIIVSDSFKEQLRSFVQSFTEEIGKMNEAFQENGVLGMFVNIADWVINGLVDSLSNPNEQQIQNFGSAIGQFIGTVAAKLVTSLPSLIGGIITIGESLAGGLVEGLFKGLFGENSEVTSLMDSLDKELNGIEINSVKAQGLLAYLEELASAGDENVTKTEAWKTAVEQLEEIMPGVKDQLEAEGATLEENIQKVRNMTDAYRKQAINQAMVNTLQKQYELLAEQGVKREKEQIRYDIARNSQNTILNTLRENIGRYAEYAKQGIESGKYYDFNDERMGQLVNLINGQYALGGEMYNIEDMTIDQLTGILGDLTTFLEQGPFGEDNIWETDQNYLSPDEINALNQKYQQAGTDMQSALQSIQEINTEMEATKSEISTTQKAVQSVTDELNGTATGVGTSGDAVVNALSGLAGRIESTSIGGGEDGSHAKGLWTVPYDDYVATLHRGERVLTASQARRMNEGEGADSGLLVAAVKSLEAKLENLTIQVQGKTFGKTVVNYGGDRMEGYLGKSESKLAAGYGW